MGVPKLRIPYATRGGRWSVGGAPNAETVRSLDSSLECDRSSRQPYPVPRMSFLPGRIPLGTSRPDWGGR